MAGLRSIVNMSRSGCLQVENLESRRLLAADWQNPVDPLDVDGIDGEGATPVDALHIINELTVPTVRDATTFRLPELGPEDGTPPPFFDVDGDQIVSPLDALLVINSLQDASGSSGDFNPTGAADFVVAGSRAAATHGVAHDTLVNTTTARVQSFADVAGFDDGSFVSVWDSHRQDGSSSGVYGQMYDASGEKLGDEFRVNSTTRKSQTRAAVATGANGQYAVVWQSLAQDGSGWGVYGQMFDSSGPVNGEFLVNQTTRGSQFFPDADFLSDGTLVVTWEGRGASDRTGIHSRMFDASGNAISDEMQVNIFEQGAQNRPAVAADGSGGYLIAWDGKGVGDNAGIFMRHFNGVASDEIRVGDSPSKRQTMASVASGPQGEYIVAWQERPEENGGWGARAQVFDASLSEIGEEIHANQTTRGLQAGTTATILDDGSRVVGWYGRGDGDRLGVFTRMYDSSGVATTDETLANETTKARQSRPAIASLGSGYVTVWDGFGDADNRGIYSRFEGGPAESNTDPMLVSEIPNQVANAGGDFNFDVSSFFTDADPGDVLSFSATSDGGELPAWLSFNSTTGVFSGGPGTGDVGTAMITVQATDSFGAAVSDTFELAVLLPGDQFTISGSIFADADGNGSLNGLESGIDGVSVSLVNNGQMIGSTTTGMDGAYSFTVDGGSYTIVVTPPAGVQTADPDSTLDNQTDLFLTADTANLDFGYNQSPTALGISDQVVEVNSPLTLDVSGNFSDPDGGDLTFGATGLPSWLSFNASTATFSGTPSQTDIGMSTVTVSATDPGGLSVSGSFQVTVQDSTQNQAPVLVEMIADESVESGGSLNKDISGSFSDPDGDTLTFTANPLPDWVSFDMTTGVFTGQPDDNDAGTVTIQVTASDGELSVSDSFDLTVTTVVMNQAPVLDSEIPDQTVSVGNSLSLDVSSNFSDPDGDVLTFTTGDIPAWVSFDGTTGQFSGTPAATDVGTVNIVVTASDGEDTVSDTFALNVEEVIGNQAPQVQNPISDQITSINREFSLNVSNTFSDPDSDTLTLSTSTLPGWLMFADGVFSGTPLEADLDTSTEITVTATDPGGLTATDTFTLAVVGNQSPVAADIQDMTATAFIPFSSNVSFFFSDPDMGDVLTLGATGLPDWLMFDSGIFTGTPSATDIGSSMITVTVTDQAGAMASDSFMLTVGQNSPPNDASTIADQVALVDMNLFVRAGEAFSDPDAGDVLSFSATVDGGALPDWLEINGSTGVLTGTPAAADVGSFNVVVTATDLANQSVSADAFQVTVTDQGTAVEITLMTVTTDLEGNDTPISTIAPGESFFLVALIQDVRTAPTGVFSAYMDVTYTPGAVMPTGTIQHDSTYGAGTSGDTSVPGLIDEVGGTDGTEQLRGNLEEVFRIEMTAGQAPGTVNFATDMAEDLVQHPLLVFSETGATPTQYVDFGTASIEIAAAVVQAPSGFQSTVATESAQSAVGDPVQVERLEAANDAVADVAIARWISDQRSDQRYDQESDVEFAVQLFVDELFD